MSLPQVYRNFGEGSIASYNYTDIAAGTGVVRLYGFAAHSSGAITYHLTDNAVLSGYGNITNDVTEESKSSADNGDADFTKSSEFDFDLTAFNLPRILTGTAIVNYSIMAKETDASRAYGFFKFVLIKDSGGSETIIGSTESELVDAGDSTYPDKKSGCVRISCTETHFKKDDILRLTVQAYMKHVSGGNNTFLHLPHSPQNRDTINFTASTYPSKLELYVPFRIDI